MVFLLACTMACVALAYADEAATQEAADAVVAEQDDEALNLADAVKAQIADAQVLTTQAASSHAEAESAEEELAEEFVEPAAANASTIDMPITVRNEQTMARQVFDYINNLRSAKGVAKLGWNTNLEKTASERAAEITLLYDYERPSGAKNTTAFPAKAKTPIGESIERCYESYTPAAQLFNNLENNAGHNSYILNKQFTSVGIAVMSTRDNGQLEYYISVCYSADASTGAPPAAKNGNATVNIKLPASLATGVVVTPATVITNVGTTVQMPQAAVTFTGGSFSRTLGNVPYPASSFNWEVADTSIASLGAGVKGNARGNTKGTAQLKDTSLSGTFNINVGKWARLWGATALPTMRQITLNGFSNGSCNTVVLATMGGYWDALSASGLAGIYQCPVLLTDPNTLSPEAANEITRLGAKRVVIAGGPAAVSDNVAKAVRGVKGVGTVERVYGQTAVDTALAIYNKGAAEGRWGKTAIIATNNGYWDALSASPYSYAQKMPIFLAGQQTRNGGMQLDAKTLSVLKSAIASGKVNRVLVCGGPMAVASR